MYSKKSISDLLKEFLIFETSNNLFDIEIKGFKFWDYIRYAVFNEIVLQQHAFKWEPRSKSRYIKYFKEAALYILFAIKWHLGREYREKYDLLVVNYDRKNLLEGKDANISFYPIIKHLRSRLKILLLDPFPLEYEARDNYLCDVIQTRRYYVFDRLLSKLIIYGRCEKRIFENLSDKIKNNFGRRIDIHKIARSFFSLEIVKCRRYCKILRRFCPSIVAFADDGNQKGLIQATHDCKVLAVDFQHSQVSSINHLYYYSDEIERYHLTTFPDYIFTFGEFWHDKYHLPVKKVAVGFPYLEMRKNEVYKSVRASDRSKNIIMITDQFSKNKYVQIALGLAKALPEFTIFYKLRSDDFHNWQERYPSEMSLMPNIKVIDSNKKTLYEYFAECSYQIGINSTAIYEGLAFNLTTFILNELWHEEMLPLVKSGYAHLVSEADEIIEKICGSAKSSHSFDCDMVFKGNSIKNIESELIHLADQRRM